MDYYDMLLAKSLMKGGDTPTPTPTPSGGGFKIVVADVDGVYMMDGDSPLTYSELKELYDEVGDNLWAQYWCDDILYYVPILYDDRDDALVISRTFNIAIVSNANDTFGLFDTQMYFSSEQYNFTQTQYTVQCTSITEDSLS